MNNQIQIQEVVDSVKDAQKAVFDAQSNNNPQYFQNAQQKLARAQQSLHTARQIISQTSIDERQKYEHAEELLRHLLEAHNSIK